jgi:hypothetical protein
LSSQSKSDPEQQQALAQIRDRTDRLARAAADAGVGDDQLAPLREAVTRLLFEIDPIGISQSGRRDEYAPEARTIALRLHEATQPGDVEGILAEELDFWFGQAADRLGDLTPLAEQLWPLVRP